VFLGLVTLGTGAFLLVRRTTLFGVMSAGIVLSNVVLLNFLFDVPDKSLSPHFTIITGLLLLPDAFRLLDVHFTGRSAPAADLAEDIPDGWLGQHRRRVKAAIVALFLISPLLVVVRARGYLWPPPPHAMSGAYEVRSLKRSDKVIQPILGDSTSWGWAVLTADASRLNVQRLDGSWWTYEVTLDTTTRRLTLSHAQRAADWRLRQLAPVAAFEPMSFAVNARTKDVLQLSQDTGEQLDLVLQRFPRRRFNLFDGPNGR
jgi:hypothetical protein